MKKVFFLFLLLSSCTLYPPYERPCIDTNEAWRTQLETTTNDIDWWKQLDDPVLDQLIQEALANNQDLQVAIARVQQYQAELGVARSKLYPQIELDALANRQKTSDSITALPSGVQPIFNNFGFIFKASYLVDLWGEVHSSVTAAYHEWLASIETRRSVVLSLICAVASTYIDLRQFDGQYWIAKETLKDREEALRLAKIRFELGLTSEIQVEQAIAEAESAKASMEQQLIVIAEAENLLSVLIGKTPSEIPRGLALHQIDMPPAIPDYLPSDLVNQRPDLQAAEQRLIAANARIGVAKSKFFPEVSLIGVYGSESTLFHNLLSKPASIWEYGSTIVQEIFTGGRLISNLDMTYAEKSELLHQYLSTILNALREANDAITSHKYNLEIVEVQKVRVKALKNYLHLSDLRYKEGQTDYLTFLDAERQLFQGLLDYEQAKGNSFRSLIQIYQALGGGWVIDADIKVINCETSSD